ncbi:MAG: NINE protein [Acetatifactor sp.]|nr:NINE protein [Acetatifactor sp.]
MAPHGGVFVFATIKQPLLYILALAVGSAVACLILSALKKDYQPQPMYVSGINPSWPIKSKIAAALLAIFLGGLGIHKFYLGKVGMGIFYLLFCWTGIPAIVGFIEGIVYLCSNDENFQLKNHVRIG